MRIQILILLAILFAGCTCNSAKKNTEEQYSDSLVLEYLKRDSLDNIQFMNKTGKWHEAQDSFTVEYRQKVNGYKVKAVLKPDDSDFFVLSADIYFAKNGKTFMLHSKDFGDTVFCKGRMDYNDENTKIMKIYNGKVVTADYKAESEDGEILLRNTPFFFQDMDFDNIPELIIVHNSEAVRYGNGYDVYRIVEGTPVLIDYPPYYEKNNNGFGMTDYPVFDFKKKTVTCERPEGDLYREYRIVYGISKKKDVVVVNGRKHYFNKLEKKSVKYYK